MLRVTALLTIAASLAPALALGCAHAATIRGESGEPTRQAIEGKASVVDGDGVEIDGVKVRLFGIDAPEVDQYCHRGDGTRWRCGQYATVALDRLAGGKDVSCAVRDRDRYGRPVAVCKVDGRDLAAEQTRAGWALAYRRYSEDYVAEERTARGASAGVWVGRFDAPWVWRERDRSRRD